MASSPLPSPHEPDALEQIRRDRGEGWDWTRIQFDPCPQCGDHPAARPPESLGALAVERAAAWREFLDRSDDEYLRASPGFGIFSPIQYGAHVRDIVRVYTDRLLLGLEQDSPTVPMFNPPQEVWEEYNRMSASDLGADIEAQARRLDEAVRDMEPAAWKRVVINDRGPYGVYSFTLSGLACNLVHEEHHHLLDATGKLPPAGG